MMVMMMKVEGREKKLEFKSQSWVIYTVSGHPFTDLVIYPLMSAIEFTCFCYLVLVYCLLQQLDDSASQ